jgi:hypothetical protein
VKKHQGNKLDFLFLVLNNIAYDATIRWYNDVVVPTIDSCQPISMPKKKSILTISYDIYREWERNNKAASSGSDQDS